MTEYRKLFKNLNFLYIWTSQILSQLAIQLLNFTFLISLYEKTTSTIATSFLWISYALPAVFVGPIAAALVDIVDKRRLLLITNLLQSFAIFAFALYKSDSPFVLYGIVVTYSFLNQFYVPAEIASIPSLVNKNLLPFANGLFFITQQAAIMFGFGLSGFFYSVWGYKVTLLTCSLFLLIAFFSVYLLPRFPVSEKIPKNLEAAFVSFFQKIFQGYVFIQEHKRILFPLVTLIGMQIILVTVMVNVPAFAKELFEVNDYSTGTLLILPGGFGAGLGAILIPKVLKKGVRKMKVIENSFIVITSVIFLLFFVFPLLERFTKAILSPVVLAILGFAFAGMVISLFTFLQEETPFKFRGRVFGNYWFFVTLISIFPVLLFGTISEIFGVRTLLFILGVIFLSSFILMRRRVIDYFNGRFI